MRGRSPKRHAPSIFLRPQRAHARIGIGQVVNIEMGVGFDPARNHDFAAGVNRPPRLRSMLVGSDECDLFALHPDAPLANPLGSDDLTAANQQVQHFSMPPWLSLLSYVWSNGLARLHSQAPPHHAVVASSSAPAHASTTVSERFPSPLPNANISAIRALRPDRSPA